MVYMAIAVLLRTSNTTSTSEYLFGVPGCLDAFWMDKKINRSDTAGSKQTVFPYYVPRSLSAERGVFINRGRGLDPSRHISFHAHVAGIIPGPLLLEWRCSFMADKPHLLLTWGICYIVIHFSAWCFLPLCWWWLIWSMQNDAKNLKMTETLAHGYSSESTERAI